MKKNILIVDDDAANTRLLSWVLGKRNYNAMTAESGEMALKKLSDNMFDLIISDIAMPGIDGFEFYRRLRKNPNTADTPFIFVSGLKTPEDQLRGLRMGADDYLTKPYDLKSLYGTIETVFAKKKQQQTDFSINLTKMNLEDLIQILELNQHTGELVFSGKKNRPVGSVFFKTGDIVHSTAGLLEGPEAFYDLFAQKTGSAKFYSKTVTGPETISGSTMSVLLEGARIHDEGRQICSMLPDPKTTFYIKSSRIAPELSEKVGSAYLSEILSMIDAGRSLGEILRNGKMSRPRAAYGLVLLIKNKHVAAKKPDHKNRLSKNVFSLSSPHFLPG